MKKAFAAAALALGLIGSSMGATAEAQQKKVTPAELGKLFPGSFVAVAGGMPIRIVASGNGRLRGEVKGMKDTGRWTVSGTRLCITWDKWLGGKTSCSIIVADNGWYLGSGVKFRKV